MNYPNAYLARTTRLQRTTNLGYAMFRCKDCCRTFNERTGTPFNFIEVPTNIVFQVLLCQLRDKLSFRDIAEFFLLQGFEFTHETVRRWICSRGIVALKSSEILATLLRTCTLKSGECGSICTEQSIQKVTPFECTHGMARQHAS